MIDKTQRVLLGRIVAAHGIRGDVVIDSYAGEPADIGAYGPLHTTAEGAEKLIVKVVRVTPKGVIAHVAGVDDRNGAEALRGTELFVPRAKLPEADDGEFYYTDLVGLRADDVDGNEIGKVVAVQNFGAGDLLELRLAGQQVTELIPFTDTFVPVVDIAAGRVVVVVPTTVTEDDGQ